MSELPKRSEIPAQHRWKLEDLFASQAEWDGEYELAKAKIKEIGQYRGKLNDPATIRACFELEDDLSIHVERLYVYAHMRHHEDTTVPEYQALSEKAKRLSVEAGEALSFIAPEILNLPEERLKELESHPELEPYRFTISELIRQKAHVLSLEEEALLAQAGNLSQAPSTIFGMINNADMKFPKIRDENGEEKELTHGSYIQFLESRDRDVRKRAFQGDV